MIAGGLRRVGDKNSLHAARVLRYFSRHDRAVGRDNLNIDRAAAGVAGVNCECRRLANEHIRADARSIGVNFCQIERPTDFNLNKTKNRPQPMACAKWPPFTQTENGVSSIATRSSAALTTNLPTRCGTNEIFCVLTDEPSALIGVRRTLSTSLNQDLYAKIEAILIGKQK